LCACIRSVPSHCPAPGPMAKVALAPTVVEPIGPGLRDYLNSKIEELELAIRGKSQNLKRLEAQRNKLNSQGSFIPSLHRVHQVQAFLVESSSSGLTSFCAVRSLREELQLLQEPGSHVGEVVKVLHCLLYGSRGAQMHPCWQ
jgi:hypothetical protein